MSSYSAEERRDMLAEDAIPALKTAIDFLDSAGLDGAVFDTQCALRTAEKALAELRAGGDSTVTDDTDSTRKRGG